MEPPLVCTMCVDVYDYDGDFVEILFVLYQDLERNLPLFEGKFWQDFNNNQLRDPESMKVCCHRYVVLYSKLQAQLIKQQMLLEISCFHQT
ncbi:MAG: hypothetical protein U0T36_08240 [Saprospiraceae bacterium]